MKTLSTKAIVNGLTLIQLLVVLVLFAGINQVTAQGTRFFRISGPAPTTIITFNPDGTLVWSNGQADTNYTVQVATSLRGGTNWVNYVQLPVTSSINTNLIFSFNPPAGMALIPAGSFTMGDTLDGKSDAIPTNVYVSAFYMDVNLVSLGQWQAVYNWATNHGYDFDAAGSGKATNHPVQTVDWYDCVKWCNARSQQAGLTPVYYTDAGLTQVYTNGEVDIANSNVNWSANGYRLPTEAEWEKAARGGLSGQRFPWGNTISESQADYDGDTNDFNYDFGPNGYNSIFANGGEPYTSPIGYFAPNGYGLYDMTGNVDQWCWDWFGTPYSGGSDPHGPSSSPYNFRVFRGGDWVSYAVYARCAGRGALYPYAATGITSIRCVRGL